MAVEPWPGYKDMSESRRKALLELKVDEARLRWDLLYAHAVAAAVANYEALDRAAGDAPGALEKAATDQIEQIAKYAGWGFEEAGGWTHG